MSKISGPLLDRIDLHLMVLRPSAEILARDGRPVARTIADLADVDQVSVVHMSKALTFRMLNVR